MPKSSRSSLRAVEKLIHCNFLPIEYGGYNVPSIGSLGSVFEVLQAPRYVAMLVQRPKQPALLHVPKGPGYTYLNARLHKPLRDVTAELCAAPEIHRKIRTALDPYREMMRGLFIPDDLDVNFNERRRSR